MATTPDFQERVARIDGLVRKIETAADPALRSTARELIESLMGLHGAGLERILEIVSTAEEAGPGLVRILSRDELVSSLLVLYGIHPDDFETRVRRGLDKVRLELRTHGVRLELVEVTEGSVHVRISGAASSDSEAAVREALFESAPDAADVVIEGGKAAGHSSGFVPLTSLRSSNGAALVVSGLALP